MPTKKPIDITISLVSIQVQGTIGSPIKCQMQIDDQPIIEVNVLSTPSRVIARYIRDDEILTLPFSYRIWDTDDTIPDDTGWIADRLDLSDISDQTEVEVNPSITKTVTADDGPIWGVRSATFILSLRVHLKRSLLIKLIIREPDANPDLLLSNLELRLRIDNDTKSYHSDDQGLIVLGPHAFNLSSNISILSVIDARQEGSYTLGVYSQSSTSPILIISPLQHLHIFEIGILNCTFGTQQESFIYQYRDQILDAANSQSDRIPPELIAAILNDELTRRQFDDDVQDRLARAMINSEGANEESFVTVIETLARKPISEISFGPAQMQQGLVVELIETGYIRQPDDWDEDQLDASLRLLESPTFSPYLVSAFLQQIIDFWREGGDCPGYEFSNGTPMMIGERSDLLATLYHLGKCGNRGVHPGAGPNDRGIDIEANMIRMGEILRCP
ncbi:MAG: hypothetical protein HC921_12580 [Synechococcaceae cyanobacterium SM2_3_1]|nr:hypothetical protein [Synechococcaceae cyanobacterium SM2_3_1]